MVKGKNLQPRILYSVRLSFTFYGEIKGFKDKQKLKRIQHNQSSFAAAAAAKSLQLCLTLCDPIDGSPPGSPIPGILQARTLEWVTISFSNSGKWKVKVNSLSRVRLLVTPWTAVYQASPSMGFSRLEYWSGCIAFSRAALQQMLEELPPGRKETSNLKQPCTCIHFYIKTSWKQQTPKPQ